MKTSLHGFMKAGLLDYDTKVREQWVGCHPGQVKLGAFLVASKVAKSCPSLRTKYVFRPRKRELRGLVVEKRQP